MSDPAGKVRRLTVWCVIACNHEGEREIVAMEQSRSEARTRRYNLRSELPYSRLRVVPFVAVRDSD